jgi:hypothetical protein
MKTIFLFAGLSCFCLTTPAQPVIDYSCGFSDGTVIQVATLHMPSVDEGDSGPGQVWDFSSLMAPGSYSEYTGTTAFSTPYFDDFPLANVASIFEDHLGQQSYRYYTIDETAYKSWGHQSESDQLVLNDPMDILRFPFTLDNSFTDSYYASFLTGYQSGSVSVEADAYGTVVLPTAKFTNCLRVKEIRNDTIVTGPVPLITAFVTYSFYSPGYPEPLVRVKYNTVAEGLSLKTVEWQYLYPVAVEEAAAAFSMHVYPNPAFSLLHVVAPSNKELSSIEVHDALGRKLFLKKEVVNAGFSVDVAAYPEGLYYLSAMAGSERFVTSFIKRD